MASSLHNLFTIGSVKRGTYCFHIPHTYSVPSQVDPVRVIHLIIHEFVTLGIADFAMGESQHLNVHYSQRMPKRPNLDDATIK